MGTNYIIKLWTKNLKEIKSFNIDDEITNIVFSKDNNYLLIYTKKNMIKILDIDSGKIFKNYKIDDGLINTATFSPNNKNIILCFYDGSIRIINLD